MPSARESARRLTTSEAARSKCHGDATVLMWYWFITAFVDQWKKIDSFDSAGAPSRWWNDFRLPLTFPSRVVDGRLPTVEYEMTRIPTPFFHLVCRPSMFKQGQSIDMGTIGDQHDGHREEQPLRQQGFLHNTHCKCIGHGKQHCRRSESAFILGREMHDVLSCISLREVNVACRLHADRSRPISGRTRWPCIRRPYIVTIFQSNTEHLHFPRGRQYQLSERLNPQSLSIETNRNFPHCAYSSSVGAVLPR